MPENLFNLRGKKKYYTATKAIEILDGVIEDNAERFNTDTSNLSNRIGNFLLHAIRSVYPYEISAEVAYSIESFNTIVVRYCLNDEFAHQLQKLIQNIQEELAVHSLLESTPFSDVEAEIATQHIIKSEFADNKRISKDIQEYSYAIYIINSGFKGIPIYSPKVIKHIMDFFSVVTSTSDMKLWSATREAMTVAPSAAFLALICVLAKVNNSLEELEGIKSLFKKAQQLYLQSF